MLMTMMAHHDPDKYKYVGILPAQISAQESGVPLVVTLCVAAEQYVNNDGGILSLVDGPHRRRPPTPDEIKAMGNIPLAYGAKGFMYYMVPTRAAQPLDGTTVFNQYGLYEEANSAFNPSLPATWVQDPDQLQVPNNRYTAVQEFISATSLIDSTLLRLRWLGADGWNRSDESGIFWIQSCSTSTSPNFSANSNDAVKYVETGYFDEDPNLSGNNPHAKYIYVVNRRCNWQGTDTSNRFIRLKIDSTVASHCSNIMVTNLKTGQKYYTTKNSNFDLYLKAGDGTLLKFEPRFVHGGTLVVDEFISEGIYEVDTTLIVPDNVKLTIHAGAKLTFQNSGKLLIEDGQLEVKGTTTNKVEFDFVAKHWSAGNGIFAYRTPLKISNAIIKNASCGIYSHISPGDTIDGVSTENTHTGISLYYSYNYGSDNTVIRNSSFEDSQLWGITMVGSRPRIHSNWFTNITEKAISASTGSAPILLRAADTVGNNRFQLNGTSIYAINSIPLLGTMDDKENYIGGNCFYEDTTSLKVVFENYQTADISAYGNDWATEDPSEFRIELVGDVTVQTDGYNSDCSGIWSNPNMLIGGSSSPKQMESGGDPDSLKSLIKDVRRMIAHGQLRDALVVLTDIINGTADVRYKKSAVSLIPQCYEYVNMSELKSNLLSIRNVGGLFKFTTRLLMNIDTENMDTYKQEILNAGNNKAYGAGDNSEEVMMIYNNLLEEKYKSSGVIDTVGIVTPVLAYLNSNFPTSEYTKSANQLFSEVSNSSVMGNGPMNKPQLSGTESVEMDYCLYNNYPNPFNPETVIKFSLKEKSNVTLTVFNIAGQKVAELVSGEMEKGMYEKKFNGTKLSSGVYIFRLNAQSLESTTHYSKTMKALLLK
ncbi:MAG: T9SS type A sorting domain-containing protein [Ignavibacteriales bacterium]|nr:T9SS type A sorting domain-containing protein [Ignavibacteriales bacterium]